MRPRGTSARRTRGSTGASSGQRGDAQRPARWIALSASHGRAVCPAVPRKVQVALMLPRQPACSSLSVGSITTTRSASRNPVLALQKRRQRAVAERQLLAAEEDEADVNGRVGQRCKHQLDHHARAPPPCPQAPSPWTGPTLQAPRQVALGRERCPGGRQAEPAAGHPRGGAGQDAGVAGVARGSAGSTSTCPASAVAADRDSDGTLTSSKTREPRRFLARPDMPPTLLPRWRVPPPGRTPRNESRALWARLSAPRRPPSST